MRRTAEKYVGQKFNLLTITNVTKSDITIKCDCGIEKTINKQNLWNITIGKTKSCGCLHHTNSNNYYGHLTNDELSREEWKLTNNGKWEVSNLGRVRKLNGRFLKPQNGSNNTQRTDKAKRAGYLQLNAGKQVDTGKWSFPYIHRLVAEAFLPDYTESLTVDHLNGNTYDNRVSNLQILTREENISKSRSIGVVGILSNGEIAVSYNTMEEASEAIGRASVTLKRYITNKTEHNGLTYYRTSEYLAKMDLILNKLR